jgi:hypothetical protein
MKHHVYHTTADCGTRNSAVCGDRETTLLSVPDVILDGVSRKANNSGAFLDSFPEFETGVRCSAPASHPARGLEAETLPLVWDDVLLMLYDHGDDSEP